MGVLGANVDRQIITPRLEALMNLKKLSKYQGMLALQTTSVSGLTATFGYSYGHIQGFYFEIEDGTTMTIPANSTGYICVRLDLSLTNTATGSITDGSYKVVTNQMQLLRVTKANLKKDVIHSGGVLQGTQRDLVLYSYTSNATTVTLTSFRNNWIYDGGPMNPVRSFSSGYSNNAGNTIKAYIRANRIYFDGAIKLRSGARNDDIMFNLDYGIEPLTSYRRAFGTTFQSNSTTQNATVYVRPNGQVTLQAYATSGGNIMDLNALNWDLGNDDSYFYPA
ncbi:hypothetical protein LP083-1_017 [Listeria phage LP-083-1]|uniref:Uncharacterized protein n=1 Tax=Listeria phage LP-083-1 TaxID=1458854 RepID=A0A059T6N4_9CAUD|nr:hypothetical protein LP083-1_017 [Listeria phage LP-083-1]